MRKDPRVWAAAIVAAAVAFGAGIAWAARVPTSVRSARPAAHRILASARLPPGASRSETDPSGGRLGKPGTYPATPNLLDLHAFWRVPGSPASAFDWIQAHPPPGVKSFESGGVATAASIVEQFVGFSLLAPRVGGAPSETLLYTVAAARGGGTALRVDAQVVWLFRRPKSERVPAGVRAVTISERTVSGTARGPWRVTDARRVRRIVAMVDRLPAAQPGAVACPADLGPVVALTFSSAASGGRTLARAVADGRGCGSVAFSIRGRLEPALIGGPSLIARLSSLLKTSLG